MASRPMARTGAGGLQELAARLGHRFTDIGRLEQALTHGSAGSQARPDNQRMEFLGDRVLGLIVAEALLEKFPAESEGVLAPRFNALVRREALAEVAQDLGLGEHLRLGRSESLSGGRRKAAILADAMEATIAAVYLDAGLEAARAVVSTHWRDQLKAAGRTELDAKTRLQEWTQARGLGTPAYTQTGREGPDHAPQFTVAATLATGERQTGTAATKKGAEQAAASALLAALETDA